VQKCSDCRPAQLSSSRDLGNSTFYNFDTVRGSRQSVGSTNFYTFSDGSNTTCSRIGSIDIYSGSDLSVSGSTSQIGNTPSIPGRTGPRAHINLSTR
jgi:hypothetical protein